MSKSTAISILLCAGLSIGPAWASGPVLAATEGHTDQPKITTYKVIDIRSDMARMRLKRGRNTVYTDSKGRKLQAEVDRKGEITGYVSVDETGKTSALKTRFNQSMPLGQGEMAIVHKCWRVTDECKNNPLPSSGNPDDCFVEIVCPKASSSSLLTR